MEPLKRIKPVQVLTDESIFEIKRAVNFLEIYSKSYKTDGVISNIANLKAIIEDVQS